MSLEVAIESRMKRTENVTCRCSEPSSKSRDFPKVQLFSFFCLFSHNYDSTKKKKKEKLRMPKNRSAKEAEHHSNKKTTVITFYDQFI